MDVKASLASRYPLSSLPLVMLQNSTHDSFTTSRSFNHIVTTHTIRGGLTTHTCFYGKTDSTFPGKKNIGLHPTTKKKKEKKKSQDAPECSFFSSWRVVKHVSCFLLLCRSHNIGSLRETAALARTAYRIRRWCFISPDWVPESPQYTQVSCEEEWMWGPRCLGCMVQMFSLWQCICIVFLWSLQSGWWWWSSGT